MSCGVEHCAPFWVPRVGCLRGPRGLAWIQLSWSLGFLFFRANSKREFFLEGCMGNLECTISNAAEGLEWRGSFCILPGARMCVEVCLDGQIDRSIEGVGLGVWIPVWLFRSLRSECAMG